MALDRSVIAIIWREQALVSRRAVPRARPCRVAPSRAVSSGGRPHGPRRTEVRLHCGGGCSWSCMTSRRPSALRSAVTVALDRGQFEDALVSVLELEMLEHDAPSWSKRAAELHRRLGETDEAIAAYERAAERYAAGGFRPQAAAMCRQILQLQAEHAGALA